MTKEEELEQALGRIRAVLETGSLDERKQYKMQENFSAFNQRLNAIETRLPHINNYR